MCVCDFFHLLGVKNISSHAQKNRILVPLRGSFQKFPKSIPGPRAFNMGVSSGGIIVLGT